MISFLKKYTHRIACFALAGVMMICSVGLSACSGDGSGEGSGSIIADVEGDAPIFSVTSGFYTEKQSVKLSIPKNFPEGTVIRYTTDGSTPTASSSKYKVQLGVLTSTCTSVIKAALFSSDGEQLSDVVTNTYVKTTNTSHTKYTVMITLSQSDLNEMVSNPTADIEKPMHVDIMTDTGEVVISQDAGIKIFGGSSRALEQKSFKIIARKAGHFGEDVKFEGKGSFNYEFFPEQTIKAGEEAGQVLTKYDSLILRNGGNDSFQHSSVDPKYASLLRDGIANNFVYKYASKVSAQLSQLVEVYLNGEYYGILDMKENMNEDYVARVYDVDDDNVVVLKSELDTSRHCELHEYGGECRFDNVWFYYETDEDEVSQSAMADFISLMKQVCASVDASDATYNRVMEKVKAAVDLESFMQYTAVELFLCNTDWPHNNLKLWKYTGEEIVGNEITDGKWRFMMRDNDMDLARYDSSDILPELSTNADTDTFYRILGNYVTGYSAIYENSGETQLYPDSLYLQGLFAFCMRDESFRNSFVEFANTLCTTTAKADLLAEYETSYKSVANVIKYHIARWNTIQTYEDWTGACTHIQSFIATRATYFKNYMERAVSLIEQEW